MTELSGMTELSEMHPSAIDATLFTLWQDEQRARADIVYFRGRGKTSFHADRYLASAEAAFDTARAFAIPLEAEFTRRPWSRYFLVTNGNGHVHREMTCSTCYPTTSYAWLPSLSGCADAAMVDEWGERACTVCFPNAPSYPRFREPSRADMAEREAREAEKRARDTARESKAIYAVDGGPLKVRAGTYVSYRSGETKQAYETYKTKIAARNALSQAIYYLAMYPNSASDRYGDTIADLIPALVSAGFDVAKIATAAQKRARKDGAVGPFIAVEEALADALN